MPGTEKQLLLQTFNSSDERDYYFYITLNRKDVERLLRRIRLFKKYRTLDPNLDEMVFDGGLGGYFFQREAYSLFEAVARPDIVADQLVVCGFDEGGERAIGSLHVSAGGTMRYVSDSASSAVQWRGLDLDGGLTIYSGPVWEHELEEIWTTLGSGSS